MLLTLMLLAGSIVADDSPAADGAIAGVVVRAADQSPVVGAEVILRSGTGGQLVPVAQTISDSQGRFRFEHLAADGAHRYQPGANRDGIHYPGRIVQLTPRQRQAEVTLAVHDAVAFPNPLVVRRHEIVLCPQAGALQVTESMLIDNPSSACYIGQAGSQETEPVTLRLAIPADFERVTFASEFFGRRFSLLGGALATSVPWPPGQRELKFSYVLPNTERHYVWQRPLDPPTAQVRVSVRCDRSEEVACNLQAAPRREDGVVSFEASQQILPAGFPLRVELGHLSPSIMAHAPQWALAMLAGLILATCLPMISRNRIRRGEIGAAR